MPIDASRWSGEGAFTERLLEQLQRIPGIRHLRVEDAPATRVEAGYSFMSNEVFVEFDVKQTVQRRRVWGVLPVSRVHSAKALTVPELEMALAAIAEIGPPDYADQGMLQYLRTERVIPAYQSRGYKLVEMVRIYEFGTALGHFATGITARK